MIYFFIIGAAFLAGIGANAFLRAGLNELIDDTEDMESTDNSFLKQIKLRYKNCVRIGHEINNTEAFIGKYMDKYTNHGLSFMTCDRTISICSGICVIGGLAGAMMERSQMTEFLILGFVAMYVVNGLHKMVDFRGKRKRIIRNLVDYFENKYYAATDEESNFSTKTEEISQKAVKKLEKRAYSEEERRIIDEILKEYLG